MNRSRPADHLFTDVTATLDSSARESRYALTRTFSIGCFNISRRSIHATKRLLDSLSSIERTICLLNGIATSFENFDRIKKEKARTTRQ